MYKRIKRLAALKNLAAIVNILLIFLMITPAYAAQSVSSKPTIKANVNIASTPIIKKISPQPCITLGKSFTLQGNNLLSNSGDATNTNKPLLILEANGRKKIISTRSWTDNKIIALLPKSLSLKGNLNIGIGSAKVWQSRLTPIAICKAELTSVNSASAVSNIKDRKPATRTPNTSISASTRPVPKPIISTRPQSTDPDPTRPTGDGHDVAADTEEEPRDSRLDNIASAGSLLGSSLPSLPEELIIQPTKSNNSSYVNNELVAVSADMQEAKELAQFMSNFQARVIRRKKMGGLGMVLSTFRLQPGTQVAEVIKQLREQQPDAWIDANHYYYPSGKQSENRQQLFSHVGITDKNKCSSKLRIGVLDGPVEISIDSLKNQNIKQKDFFGRGKKAGSIKHATAVASLLVGNQNSPSLVGIVSDASLFVGVVMQRDPKDQNKMFTTTESLMLGLDWLIKEKVQVINLSLGGPRNALLEVALNRVMALKIGVVAAAGNGGQKAAPSYPAAQKGVIAVSSVDQNGTIAKDANHGDYIDLVAPGVDVWVASKDSGGRYTSGSSMASPLVAAALALLGGTPDHAVRLFNSAIDKDKSGKDPIYGWGLLKFPDCSVQR